MSPAGGSTESDSDPLGLGGFVECVQSLQDVLSACIDELCTCQHSKYGFRNKSVVLSS